MAYSVNYPTMRTIEQMGIRDEREIELLFRWSQVMGAYYWGRSYQRPLVPGTFAKELYEAFGHRTHFIREALRDNCRAAVTEAKRLAR